MNSLKHRITADGSHKPKAKVIIKVQDPYYVTMLVPSVMQRASIHNGKQNESW